MQNSLAIPLVQPPTDLLMQGPDSLRLSGRAAAGNKSGELKRVSQEFESLFVAYLLKVMRETIEESDRAESGFGKSIYTELFDQEFAREIARQGVLGISDLLMKRLVAKDPGEGVNQRPEGATPVDPATFTPPAINSESSAGTEADPDIPDFLMPLSTPVSSAFGMRKDPFTHQMRFHRGIDLAVPVGTEVRAAMAGEVVLAGFQPSYGNTVVVQHPGGVQTRYAHLGSIEVRKGDLIAAEQVLGSVGSTGRSTGPHVHFEITRTGAQVDPVGGD